MPAAAIFEFGSHWRVMPGIAFGLRQSVMLGHVQVGALERVELAVLDRAMARHIAEPAPPRAQPQSIELALVQRALHWGAALQREANLPVFDAGQIRRPGGVGGGEYRVAVPYFAPRATARAFAWVGQEISRVLAPPARASQEPEAGVSFEKLVAELRKFSPKGLNAYYFLKAADSLDVPVRRVVSGIYRFGTGRRSRWLESSATDCTPVLGGMIAKDKLKTAAVLRELGMPAPLHARVDSPELAVKVAGQLSYPVVVKPADLDQGIGVAADLHSGAEVVAAYQQARKRSSAILVEKHFDGNDYRLTVFNGRLIKAVARIPGGVVGDGRHTVAQLIELARADAEHVRRTRARGGSLVSLDQEALEVLAQNRMTRETVAAAGQYVCLRRRANVSAGGTPVLVNDSVHPDNRRLAERAAAALRLDLAGVDLIIEDISRSWLETGALICEVNAQPQIGSGTTPGIYADILRELLPGDFRIPVVLVVGTRDELMLPAKTGSVSLGRSAPEGVWLGAERLAGAQKSAFRAGQMLMANEEIDAALLTMSPAEILHSGLPFDRCEIAVLQAPGEWDESDPASVADLLDMLLPHARKVLLTRVDHARLEGHWGKLHAHKGLEIVGAKKISSLVARALLRPDRPAGRSSARRLRRPRDRDRAS